MTVSRQVIAINRAKVEARNRKAVTTLKKEYGVDYHEFCSITMWGSSPYRLLNNLHANKDQTLRKLYVYYLRKVVKDLEPRFQYLEDWSKIEMKVN